MKVMLVALPANGNDSEAVEDRRINNIFHRQGDAQEAVVQEESEG